MLLVSCISLMSGMRRHMIRPRLLQRPLFRTLSEDFAHRSAAQLVLPYAGAYGVTHICR